MTMDSAVMGAARRGLRPAGAALGRSDTVRPRQALFLYWARLSDMAAGVVTLIAAFLITNVGRMPSGFHEFLAVRLTVKNLLLVVGFAAVWRLVCTLAGLYDWRRVRIWRDEACRVLIAAAVGGASVLVFPAISLTGAFQVATVAVWVAGTAAAMVLVRTGLRTLIDVEAGERQNFMIVGTGPRALALGRELTMVPGSRLVGYVDAGEPLPAPEIGERYLGDLQELDRILLAHTVDQVYVALPVRSRYAEIETTLQICERIGVSVSWLADQFTSARGSRSFENSGNGGVISISAEPDYRLLVVKRLIDLAGATVGLVALAPVLTVAVVAIKLTSRGPALYVQDRYGQHRRRFRMYKLRTMVDGAEALQASLEDRNEASGPVFKIKDDPRITPVGRFLRRTSIDEIPQLVNVLRGDMSLVGPRPLPLRDVARFTEAALVRRFSVRPGLTGLWQISGRSEVPFDRWIEMDLEYIDRWSLALDGKIIIRTVPAVLRGTGAT
jgi:exopolysaccharide biosynthesis polyprenyl glycosylphosphotransferase